MSVKEFKFNTEFKEASEYTKTYNRSVADKFGINLDDAINEEVKIANRNKILNLDDVEIIDDNGNVVWKSEPYYFYKNKAVAKTINPSLWFNGKANFAAGVFEVVKGKIYQIRGIDIANLTLVRSKTGWIVIDVTTYVETARAAIKYAGEALGENIKDNIRAIIISHSHGDHFGGLKGVVDEKDVGRAEDGKIPIFVPAGFDEETVKENVFAGTAMFHRANYQFGHDLEPGVHGRVSVGLGLSFGKGVMSYIRPTNFITEDTTIVIDGLEVEFQLTPGTEAPAEMNNYFPEYRAFWAAENCTGTLHNLYPIRGAQLRDSAAWWRFTEIALEKYGKKSDVVFQSHNWPHANTPENPNAVEEFLRNNAAVYKFIHDRTLLYANIGKTAKQTAKLIKLPEKLEKVWYTRPYYGSIEINSRAVYEKYLGFFVGNPTDINPLTELEEAKQFVEYVGSEERVLELAIADFEKGNYQKAAKAASYVVYVNPENKQARYLQADAFEQLGYQSEPSIWRNAYLTGARELRFGTRVLPDKREESGKSDLIANMTPRMFLDYLGIVVNGDKIADDDIRFRLLVVDPEKIGDVDYLGKKSALVDEFAVHIYHGTILYYEGHTDEELPYVISPEKVLPALTGGHLEKVKSFIDTNAIEILEKINSAVVNLSSYSSFPLIEPNTINEII